MVTASGRRLAKTITSDFNPCAWHGAATFDPRRGAELSVLTMLGAHTQYHTILTVRGGKLVTQRMPGARDGRWVVDGTVMFSLGLSRLSNGHVVERDASADEDGTWRGRRTEFAYSKARERWVTVGRSSYTTNADAAGKASGWHVRGLSRWAN